MEASLLEAAASVGLEGERISTPGMVLRLTGNMAIEEDARAIEMALRILSVAKRPGDPFSTPVEAIRRIEAAATPVGQPIDETDMLEDSELPRVVEAGRAWAHVPILAGWRATANYAFRSRRTSPAAERLVFMAVEGAARHLRGLSPEGRGDWPEKDAADRAILMPAEASWIVAPSVALTRNGFRLWSPLSGLRTFLEAASRNLSQDLGHLGTLRHELARLESMTAAASRRSRLPDLIALLKAQPVVNSAMVIDRLSVTRRTALALIGELVEAGCLVNLTGRRTARFWALPSLAARMTLTTSPRQFRRVERQVAAAAPDREEGLETEARPEQLRAQFNEERLDRIMADLDAAMAGVDEVVRRVGAVRRTETDS